MFEENANQNARIKELAEGIVLAEARIEELEQEVVTKREALITLMQQAGLSSLKLDSGLSPRLETKQRISKRGEVENERLFEWLHANGLGDLIKPSVHPGTLQSALAQFTEQGNTLPETIFNEFEQTVIRFNGKSQFLRDVFRGSSP